MLIIKYIINNYKRIHIFPLWVILFLFSLIYRIVVSLLRKRGYRRSYPGSFFLSVGNITVGGTGKTEVVSYLAKVFEKRRPAVILRGYQGINQKDALIVSQSSDVKITGDEALLLFNRLNGTVIISKKKRKGVELAKKMKRDFFLFDDAFQHWDLKRDLNLVLIDYTNPFGNDNLLPAGILREPISSLKYADGIIITKYDKKIKNKMLDGIKNRIRKYNQDCPIFTSNYEFTKIIHKGRSFPFEKAKHRRLILLTGIGNPHYFISQVKETLQPVKLELMLFKDHYFYKEKDISIIKDRLKKEYDHIITTEKDYIKLKKFNLSPLIFQIKLNIYPKDKFIKFIKDRIKSASYH